jgi:thioredoxin-dependent peroxiredoxin
MRATKTFALMVMAGFMATSLAVACRSGGSKMTRNDNDSPGPAAEGNAAPDIAFPENAAGLDALRETLGLAQETPVRLSSFKGRQNVVVAFYPKAFTPGCTAQLCGYRDTMASFADADTVVVAVSADTQEKANAFREKHGLPFPVIGDPGLDTAKAYGVPVTNLLFVKLARRSVFLVDKEGVVHYVDPSYSVDKGAAPLMDAVAQLR